MWVRNCYPIASLPLSLLLSAGPSNVEVWGNPESHFEARTEQRTPRNGGQTIRKTPEKKKLGVWMGGGSLIPSSVPGGNTTLTQTGWLILHWFCQKHHGTAMSSQNHSRERWTLAVSKEVKKSLRTQA